MYLCIRLSDRLSDHVSVRNILRLRILGAALCLLVIACFGLSMYDNDLTDGNDLPLCSLPGLLFAVIVCAAALRLSAEPALYRDAQAAYLVPRSPPLLLHG